MVRIITLIMSTSTRTWMRIRGYMLWKSEWYLSFFHASLLSLSYDLRLDSLRWPVTLIISRASNPAEASSVTVVALIEWFVYVRDSKSLSEIFFIIEPIMLAPSALLVYHMSWRPGLKFFSLFCCVNRTSVVGESFEIYCLNEATGRSLYQLHTCVLSKVLLR